MGGGGRKPTGDVYVTEMDNHRVVKYDAAGNFLETWGYGVLDGKAESQVCKAPGPCLAGGAGNGARTVQQPGWPRLDNSDGPNKGDVYIVDGPNPSGARDLAPPTR